MDILKKYLQFGNKFYYKDVIYFMKQININNTQKNIRNKITYKLGSTKSY